MILLDVSTRQRRGALDPAGQGSAPGRKHHYVVSPSIDWGEVPFKRMTTDTAGKGKVISEMWLSKG
jgi:hypothetical protein